jgi:hypothetical protein
MNQSRARESAGLPNLESSDDRVAELEGRIARLEGTPTMRERGRTLMDKVMPPEASRHFRNAGREQLLGIRSIVDFWIGRIDAIDSSAPDAGRERIELD